MKSIKILSALFFLSGFFLASCSDAKLIEIKTLQSELNSYQSEKNLLLSELSNQKSELADLNTERRRLELELSNYNRKIDAYLINHKMALAAIGLGVTGIAVSLDADNKYTQEAQDIGAMVGILAGIYALGNADEIMEVADIINQADVYVKKLQEQISTLEVEAGNISNLVLMQQQKVTEVDTVISRTKNKINELQL